MLSQVHKNHPLIFELFSLKAVAKGRSTPILNLQSDKICPEEHKLIVLKLLPTLEISLKNGSLIRFQQLFNMVRRGIQGLSTPIPTFHT